MGYISIDGGGYADWGGSPALNLIIKDYSSDIVRCFGYIDGETNASWAFDINPPNGNYGTLYKGCNKVITSRNGGYGFTAGAIYKIEVKAYYISGGTYYVSAWSNTLTVKIPEPVKPKCPKPEIVGVSQNDEYVFCHAMPPSNEFRVDVMYRINNVGQWYGGVLVNKKYDVVVGDYVYFAVCTVREGWEDSDFVYPNPIKVIGRPKPYYGFTMREGDSMDYRIVNGNYYAYPVTATKWREFCNVVNDFREWKQWGRKTFYIPSRDDNFTAVIYNSVANAINDITGYGNQVPLVGNDNYITAWSFQILQQSLNNLL